MWNDDTKVGFFATQPIADPRVQGTPMAQLLPWVVAAAIAAPGTLIAQASDSEQASIMPANAEMATATVKGSAKDTEVTKHSSPMSHPGSQGFQVAGFQVNGRFDLAYEVGAFAVDGEGSPKNAFNNYHHFLFLSRKKQGERLSFSAEVIDLSFYELGIELTDHLQLRVGKVFVPFGGDPLFHHNYGGVSGVDQKLVPFIWAEYGVVLEANLLQSRMTSIDNEFYSVAGISGDESQVLKLNGASNPGTIALGDRLRIGTGAFAFSGSFYWNRYDVGQDLFLWGFDASAGYGFLPWPIANRLAVKVGVIRSDIQSETLGNYYHFGDYLQLDYRLPQSFGLRYRSGMVSMENREKLFFDDREESLSSDDTVAHSVTFWKRHRGLTVSAELIINFEAAGEIDNDLFRLTTAFDF